MIGRWHKADLSGGFSILETDDPKAAYETAAQWADMLDMTVTPALQDEDIGPILAKYFQS